MNRSFFISTSIPYVNAKPHIGFVLELIQADVIARHARASGADVFFSTGTDENALKNVQAAEIAAVPINQFITEHAENFRAVAKLYKINYTDFIRTATDERHRAGAEKLWQLFKKADLYKKKYFGLYCLGCESFKTEKDLIAERCPNHPNDKLESVEEENYFFRLSNYAKQLEDLIVSKKLIITPESRKNEILSFIRSGLEDLSISRSKTRAKNWGIPVPGDPEQIMYVWVDALSNYINILGYAKEDEKYRHYWKAADEIIHVIGKDINRFHTVYWPSFLLSAGIRLPRTVFVHGFITIEGKKMSKSLGNVIDPVELANRFGADPVRYYLLREISAHDDGDWSAERFKERYNADLANGIGNFAARVLTLAEKAGPLENTAAPEIEKRIVEAKSAITKKVNEFRFNEALSSLWELISFGDEYVNRNKPWETSDREIISNLVILLRTISEELKSFLPETAEKILSTITISGSTIQAKKLPPLFPRLD